MNEFAYGDSTGMNQATADVYTDLNSMSEGHMSIRNEMFVHLHSHGKKWKNGDVRTKKQKEYLCSA